MTALPAVLIIGASRGLGLALAREWLSRGWTVIATARSAGQAAGLQSREQHRMAGLRSSSWR